MQSIAPKVNKGKLFKDAVVCKPSASRIGYEHLCAVHLSTCPEWESLSTLPFLRESGNIKLPSSGILSTPFIIHPPLSLRDQITPPHKPGQTRSYQRKNRGFTLNLEVATRIAVGSRDVF